MGRDRVAWYTLIVTFAALACWGGWSAFQRHREHGDGGGGAEAVQPTAPDREVTEARLQECLGKSVAEVVQLLDLEKAERHWTDEPPGILRGVSYSVAERNVTLYIAEGEPLFRKFSDLCEWNYESFLGCRVGGIQYKAGEIWFDIGPAVPWQWRRPRIDRE